VEGEQTGLLPVLRLGGLSTTPSSTLPFAKSTATKAAFVAEYIKYGFENWDGTKSPCIDPEYSASMLSLWSFVLQKGSPSHASKLRAEEPT
jgi:hypothetical protein